MLTETRSGRLSGVGQVRRFIDILCPEFRVISEPTTWPMCGKMIMYLVAGSLERSNEALVSVKGGNFFKLSYY